MQYVPARWFYVGRLKAIRLIVVHCTVTPESPTGAEAVARNFAAPDARKASAHRIADSNSIVQCVLDANTAFGAAGANADGLHLELIGYPQQSTAEWQDEFSIDMFHVAKPTIREWASESSIPYRWLTVDQVADGVTKGFCTHADVSAAFPDVSTGHWDPGPNFPKALVMSIWNPGPLPAPTSEVPEMFVATSPAGTTCLFEETRYTVVPDGEEGDVPRSVPNFGKLSPSFFSRLTKGRTKIDSA